MFYTLCPNSTLRPSECKLSRLTTADLNTLLLRKTHIMEFICGPAVTQMEIHSWHNGGRWEPLVDMEIGFTCPGEPCHIPLYKTWVNLLAVIAQSGDPLDSIYSEAQALRDCAEDVAEEGYGINEERGKDMCSCCKRKMADNLEALRREIFEKLTRFFRLG